MSPTGVQKSKYASAENEQPISARTRAEATAAKNTSNENQSKPRWSDLVELKQNMVTADEAIDYLVSRQYIDESTEITSDILSYTLLLLSASPVLKVIQEGTRAVGLILKALTEDNIAKQVSKSIDGALIPITTEFVKITKALQETIREVKTTNTHTQENTNRRTYAAAAASHKEERKPMRANIKNRQVLIDQEEGAIAEALLRMSELEIVAKANEAIDITLADTMDLDAKAISSRKLKRGGILIEMNTENAAEAIRRKKEEFCKYFSPTAKVKERTYPVKLKFVPVAHEVESEWERRRIEENSGLEREELVSTKWIKAIEKRRRGQQVGSLTVIFRTPKAANKAIREGIIIQGRRVKGDKQFYGAPRCFICQGYGHFAADCNKKETGTICATCTGTHHREQCPIKEKENYKCANCKEKGHAAWDPFCPTYKAELEKAIKKNSEIQLKFYPTQEEWTWEGDAIFGMNTFREASPQINWKPTREENNKEDGEIREEEESEISREDDFEARKYKKYRTTSQVTLDNFVTKKGKRQTQEEDEDDIYYK